MRPPFSRRLSKDNLAPEHRPDDLGTIELRDRNREHVTIDQYHIGALTARERADLVELIQYTRSIARVGVEHRLARYALCRVEHNALLPRSRLRGTDREKRVG